jgi:hypothetical protein
MPITYNPDIKCGTFYQSGELPMARDIVRDVSQDRLCDGDIYVVKVQSLDMIRVDCASTHNTARFVGRHILISRNGNPIKREIKKRVIRD